LSWFSQNKEKTHLIIGGSAFQFSSESTLTQGTSLPLLSCSKHALVVSCSSSTFISPLNKLELKKGNRCS